MVQGTEEAIREEMLDIFGSLDKDAGQMLRVEVEKLSEVLWADCRPGGASYEAVVDLSRLH